MDSAPGPSAGIPRPARVEAIALVELAARHGLRSGTGVGSVSVTGVTAASDYVRAGDLFAALPGSRTHGAAHAADAIGRGAVAVLTDAAGAAQLPPGVPTLLADDVRGVLGHVAASVYRHRPARIIGVTGTSGKTTSTFFLRAGLRAAGRRAGLIGTVATYLDDDEVKTGFTTPEAPELHALLADMAERGVTDVAMEVSSHALALGRVGGVPFDVGGFTNLSQDHLDFHTDMADYFRAKAKLFEGDTWPVIVVDDEWGRTLADSLDTCTTVSIRTSAATSWWAEQIDERPDGTIAFVLASDRGVRLPARIAIPGRFNVANAVLAVAMLDRVGVDPRAAADAIAQTAVPGRMERIDAGQDFLAVVDYSHKPAAVSSALAALRRLTRGRLIVVLGCGGDRDVAKRPVMGEIAARAADVLIVTDDNPRSEDPAAIRAAMLAGANTVPGGQRAEIAEIGDRAAAIHDATMRASSGDTVLVAGKGHEQGQEIGGVVHPFDDRVVLRAALEASRS